MSIFSTMDWPYAITKVQITDGAYDASGNWTDSVEVETSISGHVSDLNEQEIAYVDPSLREKGVRKFSCEQTIGLQLLDHIKITEADASETTWEVHSIEGFTGLLSSLAEIDRETFLLRKIQA